MKYRYYYYTAVRLIVSVQVLLLLRKIVISLYDNFFGDVQFNDFYFEIIVYIKLPVLEYWNAVSVS